DRYAHCWRYEVELHNDVATETAHRLEKANGQRTANIASMVWKTYQERGILADYAPEDEQLALPASVRSPTDTDRRLSWLREQVRPACRALALVVPHAIILEALGLVDEL